jgi:type II secretory pathway component GspD/PulD (secretin)
MKAIIERIRFSFVCLFTIVSITILLSIARSETEKSTTDSNLPHGQFIDVLPSGVTVELVGMCEYPSDVNTTWYKPDGSLLNEPPCDGDGTSVINTIRTDSVPAEFIFRLSGNIKQPAWNTQVKTDNTNVLWSGGRKSKNGQFVSDIKSVGMWIKWDQKIIDLRLGFFIDGRLPEWIDFNNVSVANLNNGEEEILRIFFDMIDTEIQKLMPDYPQLVNWNKVKTQAGLYGSGKEITGKRLVYDHAVSENTRSWMEGFEKNGCYIIINLFSSTIEGPRGTGKTKSFAIKDTKRLFVSATVVTANPENPDLEQKINEIIAAAAESAKQKYDAQIEAEKISMQIGTEKIVSDAYPEISDSNSLLKYENKNQIVQMKFKLKYKSPSQMEQILKPMIGPKGYLIADESSQSLMIINTVTNLIQIERVISTFDVPDKNYFGGIFEIKTVDPNEILDIIRLILGDANQPKAQIKIERRIFAFTYIDPNKAAEIINKILESSVDEPSKDRYVIPMGEQKQLIAKASSETMKKIEQWVQKLDVQGRDKEDYELIDVKYVDVTELANTIKSIFSDMQTDYSYYFIEPLPASKQLLIFGKPEFREMVKKLVFEIDIPAIKEEAKINFQQDLSNGRISRQAEAIQNEPNRPAEPNEEMVSIGSWSGYNSSIIVKYLEKFTGKKVVIQGEQNLIISLYATQKMPKSKAIQLFYRAINLVGYTIEETEDFIYIRPKFIGVRTFPTITDSNSLLKFENKDQFVQMFFKLRNTDSLTIAQIIESMVSKSGYLSADKNTRTLMIIDTVGNLIHIEHIISLFDAEGGTEAGQQIFDLKYIDPNKAEEIINKILVLQIDKPLTNTFVVTVVEAKQLIARASSETMKQIQQWITQLDTPDSEKKDYELITVKYVDVVEVADSVQKILVKWQEEDLKNIFIQSMPLSRQLLIFGNDDDREIVRKVISEVDIPSNLLEKETFTLKFADTESVKRLIDGNFRINYNSISPFTVRVNSYPFLKQITVLTSAENMEKIRKLISESDQPFDIGKIKPKIIELQNVEPQVMLRFINSIFSKIGSSNLTRTEFADVPGTKKIIVVSNSIEVSDVAEFLIRELDNQKMANLPVIFQIRYAVPDEIRQKINERFNSSSSQLSDNVSVIAYPSQRQVIVIASEGNIEKVRQLIQEIDRPQLTIPTETTKSAEPNDFERIITLPDSSPESLAVIGRPAAKQTFSFSADPNKIIEVLGNIVKHDMVWLSNHDSLAEIENKDQLVLKSFGIKYANPSNIMKIISPLIDPPGAIITEDSNNLSVYGTVGNLLKIERIINFFDGSNGIDPNKEAEIINLFDVSDRYDTHQQIFDLKYIDPNKAAEIINKILVLQIDKPLTNTFVVTVVEAKQLIASASAENMKQIQQWITQLDTPDSEKKDYELITVKYVDVKELTDSLYTLISNMQTDYAFIFIQPLPAAKQLLIYGKPEVREMIKKLVAEVDKPDSTLLN